MECDTCILKFAVSLIGLIIVLLSVSWHYLLTLHDCLQTFATLSPIPGFMQWLLSKLASQSKLAEAEGMSQSSLDGSGSTFWENILEPEEEKAIMDSSA
jgi:hypothetical protein